MNFFYLLKPEKIEVVDGNNNPLDIKSLKIEDDFWNVDWEENSNNEIEKIIKEAIKSNKNLTLFLNRFENIKIDKNLPIKKVELEPIIIFKEVSENKSLIFEITSEFEDYDINFFINFMPQQIFYKNQIIECDYSKLKELKEKLKKYLKRIKGVYEVRNFEFLLEENVAKEFLEKSVYEFLDVKVYGSEKLKKYNYAFIKPKINLKVDFENKVSLFDEIDVEVDDEKISLFQIFEDYKKYGYVLIKNKKGIVDKKYIEKLKKVFKRKEDKFEVSIFDVALLENIGKVEFDKSFFEEFNKLKDKKFEFPKLNVTLRDYQKFGVKWLKLLYDYEFGGCLADDMGLGKTIQTIALIKMIYKNNDLPILIVLPKSLVFNWEDELKKFANLDCLVVKNKKDLDSLQKINLITYGFLRENIEKLKEIEFDTIILDEAQNIKNITSKISKAVRLLKAKHKFALSGTPIENNLFELYAIFDFLNPGIFGSVEEFKQNYVNPVLNNDEEASKELKAKISPFILRRLKQDVLDELPDKEEIIVYVDMDDNQKKEYENLKKMLKQELDKKIEELGFNKSKFFLLRIFQELRKKAIFVKIDEVANKLNEAVNENHKVLVFSNFLSVLEAIEKKVNFEYLKMTGVNKNRQELVEKFNKNENIKAMLMTLKVGGVGLNLISADYVFIVDPWWNVATENQAIDRIYRIGQDKKVFSYKFITKETIEEKILALQKQKKDLANAIIKADAISKVLSEENIKYLLGDINE